MRVTIEPTPENRALVEAITGKPETFGRHARRLIMLDGVMHRPNGRFIVGNVPRVDAEGNIRVEPDARGDLRVVTVRHRFRIPKGHPWRGTTPR